MKSSVSAITKAQAVIVAVVVVIAGIAGLALVGMQPQQVAPQPAPKPAPQPQQPAPAPAPVPAPQPAPPPPDPRIAAAKGESGLLIYSSIDAQDFAPIQTAFEAKYPDLKGKITFLNMRPPEAYSRITSELQGGKPTADMIILSYTTAQQLQKDKLFMPYKSKELSGFNSALYDANGEWASALLLPVGFGYNTQLVKKDDLPKKLLELTNAKWAGKTEIHTLAGGSLGTQYVASLKEVVGDADYNAFLNGLITNVKPKPNTAVSGVSDDIAKGEVAIGISVYLHDIIRLKEQGAPVDFFLPQGIPLLTVPSAIAIMTNVKSLNTAQLLEDFILSADGQKVIGNISVRFPARSGVTGVKYSAEAAVAGAQVKLFPSPEIAAKSSALAADFKKMGFG